MSRVFFKVGEIVEYRHRVTEFDGCKGIGELAKKGERGKVVKLDEYDDDCYLVQHSRWGTRVWLHSYEIAKVTNVLDMIVNEAEDTPT